MYCIECGKANPPGAKFCAYCGRKLFTGETEPGAEEGQIPSTAPQPESLPRQEETAPAPQEEPAAAQAVPAVQQEASPAREEPAPAAPPAEARPVYERRRPYKTLRPLAENPAQPEREGGKSAPAAAEPAPAAQPEPAVQMPIAQEDVPEELDEQESAREPEEFLWRPENGPTKPLEDLWAETEEGEETPAVREHRIVFPWQRKKEENMVLTSSGTEEMPERRPVIARRRRDTHIPQRIVRPVQREEEDIDLQEEEERQDIFFMRPRKPRGEDSIDDAYVNSRVRTILLSIAFCVCLGAAIWLFATSSGSMFLAGFNLSTDAQAYRDLGDTALSSNQIKRAAEAYYKALSLDPDNYEIALLVGKTQQQIGEYDTAANAYYLCTQLRPTLAEPYEALIRLYEIQGESEKAEYFRELGEANTGQTDLGQ